jgi:hypothetical protein
MTKLSMCRYSYKKSVEISKHFSANRLQQNNKPLLQQPNASMCRYFNRPKLLCVDIPTDQSTYVSIFLQTKVPMCRYYYRPKLLCVDIPTDQSSYVSIFLQTKVPMCRYYYRPKLLCVDIPTETSRYFNELKLLCCDTSTSFFVL